MYRLLKFLFFALSCCIVFHGLAQSQVEKHAEAARYYEQQRDTARAIEHHKKVVEHARKAGLPEHEARALLGIARLLQTQNADSSMMYLQHALQIAHRIGHPELKADIFRAIADIHKSQENYREAMLALEEHHRLLDTIFERSKQREVVQAAEQSRRRSQRIISWVVVAAALLLSLVLFFYFWRMRKVNRELRMLGEVKDKVFSVIGHDLRGPAGNTAAVLGLVNSGEFNDAEKTEMLQLLEKQSVSFYETLENLLVWATTQLNGMDPIPVAVYPRELVQQNWETLAGQSAAKGLMLQNRIGPTTCVYADKGQLDIIIRNLLSNAIKFSYEGGMIEVDAVSMLKEVILSVRDHGPGMAHPKQEQFRNAGYVQSGYGTKGEKGTGIGLAVTKEFVKANGGRVWVESEEGKGAVFYVGLKGC